MHNVLILGGGGREHALGWKLAQSPRCKQLFFGPGNAGTAQEGHNLDLDPMDFEAVQAAIEKNDIAYLIVGPEAPLVAGITDYFEDHSVKVIGPSQKGAQLEGSKSYANAFMDKFNIPTSKSVDITADNLEEGYALIDQTIGNIVLKADGLAAGKGVLILEDKAEAKQQLKEMIQENKFGVASEKVVIEEFLDGIEFSVFVVTDGQGYKLLPIAKDYKRIGEGDTGLNTGGMGAVSPVPFVDVALMEKVEQKIIQPTIAGLQQEKIGYNGILFIGLILVKGEPYVIEYNCRLGDPETEVILPRLDSDLMDLFIATAAGDLNNEPLKFSDETAATIMLVSGGYPEKYEKGKIITFDNAIQDTLVFHAGTKLNNEEIITSGGRVIALTSFGSDHKAAIAQCMNNIDKVHFEKMHYRTDIGFDL